jgi:hypothetical protein
MNSARDNMIWFNLSPQAMENGDAGPLLEHYGGEVVYMPLTNLGSISLKIRDIGQPLVVKCRLNPNQINGFWEYPIALVWLSAYHTKINPNARFYDQDIYSTTAIPLQDILSVETAQKWR